MGQPSGQIRPELYSGHCGGARFHEHLPSDRVGKPGRALQADDAAKQRERDGDGAERSGGAERGERRLRDDAGGGYDINLGSVTLLSGKIEKNLKT